MSHFMAAMPAFPLLPLWRRCDSAKRNAIVDCKEPDLGMKSFARERAGRVLLILGQLLKDLRATTYSFRSLAPGPRLQQVLIASDLGDICKSKCGLRGISKQL